ncbi:MAG: SMP-30/gluconolactonase/LRE family protein [Verrucomicrobia bacterium]|nr:SMP-30/gluconolactonase/LRE family protein [Verrucomicrobiota bacterium]
MNTTSPTRISKSQAILGEGPVWHRDRLLWVDIEGRKVIDLDPSTGTENIIELSERVGCVWPCADSNLLLCGLQTGLAMLDPDTGTITPIDNPEPDLPTTRFNDGKCDPLGRFWAGTMDMDEKGPLGSLYMLDHQHLLTRQWQGVTVSNGLAWDMSADHPTFYYIDSPTRQVVAFDYEPDTGSLSNRRVAITIPDGEGFPDGMTIDSEGALWIALWQGWGVVRYNPKTGERLGKIDLPVEKVTSCTFGGPDLSDLFITTASIGLGPDAKAAQPDAGAVFRVKTDSTGLPTILFRTDRNRK